MEHILEHPELPWNWDAVSANNNITMDNVLQHPDFTDYIDFANKRIANNKIKRSWHQVITNPHHSGFYQCFVFHLSYDTFHILQEKSRSLKAIIL